MESIIRLKSGSGNYCSFLFSVNCLHTQNNNHPFPYTCCSYVGGLERVNKGGGNNAMSNLTTKQENFVQAIISGMSQREAYKHAYDCKKMKDTSIDSQACKLFRSPKVATRYKELMEEHKNRSLWSREQAVNDLIWLKEQARNDVQINGVRQANSSAFISAIKELNQLEDLYPKDKPIETNSEKTIIITNEEEMRRLINEQ